MSVVEAVSNHLSVVHVGRGALRVPALGVLVKDSPDVRHVFSFDLGRVCLPCFEAFVHVPTVARSLPSVNLQTRG